MRSLVCLTLLVLGLAATAQCGTYLITAPSSLQPGAPYDVSVDILNGTSVEVVATLQSWTYNGTIRDYDVRVIDTARGEFGKGRSGTLPISLNTSAQCNDCRLKVRGTGDVQFERTERVTVNSQTVVILVQTDKAMYKPGQMVRFRVFVVYPSLKLYSGALNIEIKDPNHNKVKVMPRQVAGRYGVVQGELQLSDEPTFGDWTVTVVAEETLDRFSQSFTVANYELPRFEVSVELPPFGLKSHRSLTGKVTAKYTFGKNVTGRVELHVGKDEGPGRCGEMPRTTQISFDIDGSAAFEIPKVDIQRAVSIYGGTRVKVTAFVTEEATGVRLNGSSVITYYVKDTKLQFLENTPAVFKPGLPYTAYIQATTPDGKSPPAVSNQLVSVYTLVRYSLKVPDQSFYAVSTFEGSYPLPGENKTLPANGVLPVSVTVPLNATSIEIKATFRGVTATKRVEKSWSPSNNYLRLSLVNKNVKTDSIIYIKVEATETLSRLKYEVISRGTKVISSEIGMISDSTFNFDMHVMASMAPVAHVLAYYFRDDGEVVADAIAFEVDGLFDNQVSVRFDKNQSQPNERVTVQLTADPGSMVNVLAVDQSVLLLKSGNDVTPQKVADTVSKFDRSSKKPSGPDFELSHSSTNAKDIFTNAGLLIISDANMEEPFIGFKGTMNLLPGGGQPQTEINYFKPAPKSGPGSFEPASVSDGDLVSVDRVRNIFPETWLWADATISNDGTANITTTSPDTITSWVVSAVATNPTSGLGVAPTTAKLRVFRPFFLSLTYPNMVIRGEHVVVQATVFNYLATGVTVVVTMKETPGLHHVSVNRLGEESLTSGERQITVDVPSEGQGVVYFPIAASDVGVLELEVTARSAVAADGVRRFINVESEGAPVSFNQPLFINLDNSSFSKDVQMTLPPSSYVPSAKVKVTGDLIGPSLDNLASLLKLPTGCGEQSMVKFAPDLYIGKYLQASGQMTTALEKRIKRYLSAGYQRQLSFQRYDRSFSAFGNRDETGSTWLTAMVAGAFSEARDWTYVDPAVITQAISWLVSRQRTDGSFVNFGKVLDPNTQRARTGEGLTSYILVALLQAFDLPKDLNTQYRWSNATERAVSYLESHLDSVRDPLSLSMVTYALNMAGSTRAQDALDKLDALKNVQGELMFWGSSTLSSNTTRRSIAPSSSTYLVWRPPKVEAKPTDILTTSYAILALTAAGRVTEAYPAVQWLAGQRTARGGFQSSQDTVVGLQALAAYASASSRAATSLNITVSRDTGAENITFAVDMNNAWNLQVQKMSEFPITTSVHAEGSGFALVEVEYTFHVTDELSTPSFDVSTVMLDDDLDSFNLMVCTKWLWDRDTGMVVQEISIPSGFEPDLSTLGAVAGLQKSERRASSVAVYFDNISKSSLCYSIIMTRSSKVAKSQSSYVRTYDYYQPGDQSTVFYNPRRLRESTICDVCDECCN